MRCPKCQYIGFDEDDRCRHCGYEFSLAASDSPFDLPIRDASSDVGPIVDLALDDGVTPPEPRRRASAQTPAAPTPAGSRRGVTPGFDLPLFEADDDAPLVTVPAVPRPPLSVRRPASHTPRTPLPTGTPDPDRPASGPRVHRRVAERSPSDGEVTAAVPRAPNGLRVLAAAIDLAIIGGIDLAVVYFTLRVCGLSWGDASGLPVVPLAAFFLLLNGGYATIFTAAAGQTIGKMLAGIRVVPAAAEAETPRLAVSTALVREAACLLSLIPAGVGFLVALVRADGRALHDALVDTRVVRA